MWDSHCHLDFPEFDETRDADLARARELGVSGWIVPGVHAAAWERQDGLSSLPGVVCAAGVHPYWVSDREDCAQAMESLGHRLQTSRAVAVGECGLDAKRGGADLSVQVRWFEAQLDLARSAGLPVIVHQVGAREEFLAVLTRHGRLSAGGVVHGFSGDGSWAKALLDRGLHLGIGVQVARPGRERLRAAVADLPAERLLLETDGPDQGLDGERGRPSDLVRVCAEVAALRGRTPGEVAESSDQAVRELFRVA